MKTETLAEADMHDGRRTIHLLTDDDNGDRFLKLSGARDLVPLPSAWSRDQIGKLALWLVGRNAPMRVTCLELLKELGSTHVQ